ncbi:hypothetical protein AK812_SmicGene43231 [Symbiodinium microadriaticum]|uniref:Uncharacterized protein n=2 Tax=Symbiodinium microadriaticum TaxID=2951 RepID=A0A1Q9C1J7_SYMMI|nr:hypothetical protein AK812_SmicGene43231 [Symbiodinium microadriaticum]
MPSDGRHGPRRPAGEDLDYEKLVEPIDEGEFWQGPLIVCWGAEELYATTSRTGAVRQKGHSCMPPFLKRRWYDAKATQVQVDVRNPLCVYGSWKGAADQPEFPAAFVMVYWLLQAPMVAIARRASGSL